MRAALPIVVLSALFMLGSGGSVFGQNTLPSAPAPQQPGPLKLPPAAPIMAQPHTPAPPPPEENVFCSDPLDQEKWEADTPLNEAQKKEMNDFVGTMMHQMSPHWLHHIPEQAKSQFAKGRTVMIRFDVHPDGTVSDLAVMMSAGQKSYDQHAIDTIQSSAPFPLPSDIQQPIHACVRFYYNMNPPRPKPVDPLDPYALPPPKMPPQS
jgi:TonB family protein